MADIHSPLRCESCGSAIAPDELEHAGREWSGRQSFDDWDVVVDTDILEHVQNATFVALHPSFAMGCICPSCRQPFTYPEADDGYADPFADDDDNQLGEVPF